MPLLISCGKIHDYLGMVFGYTTDGEVSVHMYQYIEELIKNAPERYKVGLGSATPAPSNLYEVRDQSDDSAAKLSKQMREE